MEIWIVCCHMDACFSVEPWFKMHRAASLFCRRGKLTGRHVDRVCAHVSRKWSMLWQDFIQMHLKRIKSQTSFPALSTNSTRQRVGDDCLPRRKASTAADPRFVSTRRFFKTPRIFGYKKWCISLKVLTLLLWCEMKAKGGRRRRRQTRETKTDEERWRRGRWLLAEKC